MSDYTKIRLMKTAFCDIFMLEVIGMSVKQEALLTLDSLPETATWDDAIYALYVKQKVMRGLQDARDGKTVSHEDAMKRVLGNAR